MALNRRSKHTHTTRNEQNDCKISCRVADNSKNDKEFSERLSRVLNHCAVNENLIQFKRKIMFAYEREMTNCQKALGRNRRSFIFGSQIEVTTTLGMRSDIDRLYRLDTFRLFLHSDNPPSQLYNHQVVIKVSTNGCASQFCVLTIIEPSIQAMRFEIYRYIDAVQFFRRDWTSTDGMIPHSIMFDTLNQHPRIKNAKRHGPATCEGNTDSVNAFYCKSLPKQCKFVFERPRPGHWPSEKTLKKAQTYGVFIVPQGPPKSTNICTNDYFEYQWRLSSNQTERLLMFSLDIVHLQAYVLTKILRKELFVPEYQDRLSTYHFKTAFFFAVENTPSHVWREDNIYNCVKYILATLRRFLTRRNCPHFTIENVNLFEWKIKIYEFPKLVDKFTNVIHSLRTHIEHIQASHIGESLKKCNTSRHDHSRYTLLSALFGEVKNYVLEAKHGFQYSGVPVSNRIEIFENEFSNFETCHRAPIEKYRKYDYEFYVFMSALATFGASAYLEHIAEGNEYNSIGINKARHMYIQSLKSDIIGDYVRYASFLFCNGEYDEACTYFDVIEKQIEEDKQSNLIYQLCVSPSESLTLDIAKQDYKQIFKQRFSVFLIFTQQEAMCVPEFLRCEMYRRRLGTVGSAEIDSPLFLYNENNICVHIEPYLYYLQYHTYRLLNHEPKKSKALMKLLKFQEIFKPVKFITEAGDIFMSNIDTSLNMIGHCLELEQQFQLAWLTYTASLIYIPQRNAAVLHKIRLLWNLVQSLRT